MPWSAHHSRLFSGRLFQDRKTESARVKGYTLRPLANFKTIGSSSMPKWLVRLFIVMMLVRAGVASLIGIYFYIKPQLRASAPCAMSNHTP